jgi:spore coat polysaccharide biosynthesis protein SpsF (cytidylyltransferase family)
MMRVLIGIQARMASERLPGKALMLVGGKPILSHVVASCIHAAKFMNSARAYQCVAKVALLVPEGESDLIDRFKDKVDIVEGDKDDVLSRYLKARDQFQADWVVRVTGDCLYIPSHVISRHIKQAIREKADYCQNVLHPMNPEGWDTEVLSTRILDYLNVHATSAVDKEHVTTYLRKEIECGNLPPQYVVCSSTEQLDMSSFKTSIDTREDLNRALADFEGRENKKRAARTFGRTF